MALQAPRGDGKRALSIRSKMPERHGMMVASVQLSAKICCTGKIFFSGVILPPADAHAFCTCVSTAGPMN